MANLSREYCAYFGEATEVWKRHVIGEIIVAFDEYRDSICQTLQDAANSGPNPSTGGGQDVNNQEEVLGVVLENAQQQAEQRIVNAVNQTLNQPPPVLLSPVVSIIANQAAQVNPPDESAIFHADVNSVQNDDDDNSLDVSIKSEVDSSSESECESDTDDEVQVKEEPIEVEEDITGGSEEQTENDDNNSNYNHETNDFQNDNSNAANEPNAQAMVIDGEEANLEEDHEIGHVVAEDYVDGNLEEDEHVDDMETEENNLYDCQESDNEGSMIDEEENGGEESDHFEDQVNMSGVEENDEEENDEDSFINDSSDETTDEEQEQTAGPSTSTGRRSTRQVSKRQSVPAGKSSKGPIKVKKSENVSIITKKLKCTVPGCKKVVKSKSALNSHFLTSHKLRRYRCLVRRCYGKVSTSFTTRAQFSDHLDQVHGSTARLACHCSKKFKSYKELGIHYWHYHQLGLFACSKEGCSFKPTRPRMKVLNHLRNHREAKYECPVDGCDRSFKLKGNLDKHRITHTGELPFVCTECDKSFNRKSNLISHLRIHRKDKCYRCTWPGCTYSSTNRSNVITHIRTVHFELPATKKKQAEENIIDDRDPRDYLAMD